MFDVKFWVKLILVVLSDKLLTWLCTPVEVKLSTEEKNSQNDAFFGVGEKTMHKYHFELKKRLWSGIQANVFSGS